MSNTAEEKRIRKIDEVACAFDPATVEAAKHGPDACTAQEMAYRAAQRMAQAAKAKALVKDQSGVDLKLEEARATVKALLRGED